MHKASVRWWHTLIGKNDTFKTLLEAAADEVQTSVALLSAYLQSQAQGAPPPPLADFAESRRRQKKNRHETINELHKSLMPPLDREDIQALAFALYRIPKTVEKIVERTSIYPGQLPVANFQRQAEFLRIAAEAVVFMAKQLLSGTDMERINVANARLQAAEGEADKMMLLLLKDLYEGPYEPKEVVILQGYYELMERAVDRCRNVGSIVIQIVMKNV